MNQLPTSYRIAILITGSEFSMGLKQDSNSRMIADLLRPYAVSLTQIILAPDNLEQIVTSLKFLSQANDLIIISGGLGPTQDDLTRFAVAQLLQKELIQDANTLLSLEQLFAKRNRPLYESNKLQALFPIGSTIINNPIGTAAGFLVNCETGTQICCLPGVPSELKKMIQEFLIPEVILRHSSTKQMETKTIRLFGLPESQVGEIITKLNLPSAIDVCYQASFPEIQVIISGSDLEQLQIAEQAIEKTLGQEKIFSRSLDLSLEQALHAELLRIKKSLAVAESCSGGQISALITSNAGCSSYFYGAAITYTQESKHIDLGVPIEIMKNCQAVSSTVAEAMATGAQTHFNTDLALAITGFAGPDGGTKTDPVGTFYIAIKDGAQAAVSSKHFFLGERSYFQRYASYSALQFLLQHIKNTPHNVRFK